MLVVVGTREDGEQMAEQWHELMSRYHHTMCALDRALLDGHGITVSEFEVLQQLQRAGGEKGDVRMHMLADNVHLSQSALSRVVASLEKASLVERAVCVEDRRSVWVKLTEAGARRFAEAKPTHRTVLKEQAS
jgi:DNA-binding MarR family transcriptional regulator